MLLFTELVVHDLVQLFLQIASDLLLGHLLVFILLFKLFCHPLVKEYSGTFCFLNFFRLTCNLANFICMSTGWCTGKLSHSVTWKPATALNHRGLAIIKSLRVASFELGAKQVGCSAIPPHMWAQAPQSLPLCSVTKSLRSGRSSMSALKSPTINTGQVVAFFSTSSVSKSFD